MKAFVTVAAIASALVAAAPARASDIQRVSRYITTARAAWPGSPCAGRERFIFHVQIVKPTGEGADGVAHPEQCVVELRTGMRDARLCDVLTHELGHLAGAQHAASGVMRPSVDPWPPCTAAADVQAHIQVRAALPLAERAALIRCTPMRFSYTPCVSRSRGASRRWQVPML